MFCLAWQRYDFWAGRKNVFVVALALAKDKEYISSAEAEAPK